MRRLWTGCWNRGLRLNRDKCVFLAETVVLLGHKIDQHGLHPMEEKVRAVQAAPKPLR